MTACVTDMASSTEPGADTSAGTHPKHQHAMHQRPSENPMSSSTNGTPYTPDTTYSRLAQPHTVAQQKVVLLVLILILSIVGSWCFMRLVLRTCTASCAHAPAISRSMASTAAGCRYISSPSASHTVATSGRKP